MKKMAKKGISALVARFTERGRAPFAQVGLYKVRVSWINGDAYVMLREIYPFDGWKEVFKWR